MPRLPWLGLSVLVVACGGRSFLLYGGAPAEDSGSSNDASGSSSGIVSSSGTSSGGIGSSTSSGSGGSSGSGSSSGSSGSSSGSSSGVIEAGTPSCQDPASSVPSSEVLPYVPVVQMKGACAASDIAGFITACDSPSGTNTGCNNWFQSASPTCLSCLGAADAGISRTGALDTDYQGNFIGANAAGCLAIVDGNTTCASAYEVTLQCFEASGCGSCNTQVQANQCEGTIFGNGGACYSYIGPYNSLCMADNNPDGGAFYGQCSDDTAVLSVICGNGSGDGG